MKGGHYNLTEAFGRPHGEEAYCNQRRNPSRAAGLVYLTDGLNRTCPHIESKIYDDKQRHIKTCFKNRVYIATDPSRQFSLPTGPLVSLTARAPSE